MTEQIEDQEQLQETEITSAPSVEDRASELGWKEDGELSAEEFIKHKDILSSKQRKEQLLQENREIKAKLEKHEQLLSDFQKHQAERMERQKAEHAEQIAGLRQQRAEAIRNGDGDAVNELEDRIDLLKERKPVEAVKAEEPQPERKPDHPQWADWKAQNQWVEDPIASAYAQAAYAELAASGDDSTGVVLWEKVKAKVARVLPDKFGNQNRAKPSAVESGSTTRSQQDVGAVAKMSAQDRRMMDDLIGAGAYKAEAKRLGVSELSLALKDFA